MPKSEPNDIKPPLSHPYIKQEDVKPVIVKNEVGEDVKVPKPPTRRRRFTQGPTFKRDPSPAPSSTSSLSPAPPPSSLSPLQNGNIPHLPIPPIIDHPIESDSDLSDAPPIPENQLKRAPKIPSPRKDPTKSRDLWTTEQYLWLLQHEPLITSGRLSELTALLAEEAEKWEDPGWGKSYACLYRCLARRGGLEGLAKMVGMDGVSAVRLMRVADTDKVLGGKITAVSGGGKESDRGGKMKGSTKKSKSPKSSPPKAPIIVHDFTPSERTHILRHLYPSVLAAEWGLIAHSLDEKAALDSTRYRSRSMAEVAFVMGEGMGRGGWWERGVGRRERREGVRREGREEVERVEVEMGL